MKNQKNNYAFIDAQNLYRGVTDAGWRMDYRKFRVWLKNRYGISHAHMFFGFMPQRRPLYEMLRRSGFELEFRDVDREKGFVKGNVDVLLTLHAVQKIGEYNRGYLVTSDGDFAPIVRLMQQHGRFGGVISPHEATCSRLLKKAVGGRITYLEDLRSKLEHKK